MSLNHLKVFLLCMLIPVLCIGQSDDSVWIEKAKTHAFEIAAPALELEKYYAMYTFFPDDSSYQIVNYIMTGNLFEDGNKYFFLRSHTPASVYFNLYKISGNNKELLLSKDVTAMGYINDTIFDVNGDGYYDFLIQWYPPAGCCLRYTYDVYLYNPDGKGFPEGLRFINPTFSPEEYTVHGILYGHPGDVGLYKYKWNGLSVDTIEFIFPDITNEGHYIKTDKSIYRPTPEQGEVLKSVPPEYHSIKGYSWFLDDPQLAVLLNNSDNGLTRSEEYIIIDLTIDSALKLDPGLNTKEYWIDFSKISFFSKESKKAFLWQHKQFTEVNTDSLFSTDPTWQKYGYLEKLAIIFRKVKKKGDIIIIELDKIVAMEGGNGIELRLQKKNGKFVVISSKITWIS